jgi:hypothetical protein
MRGHVVGLKSSKKTPVQASDSRTDNRGRSVEPRADGPLSATALVRVQRMAGNRAATLAVQRQDKNVSDPGVDLTSRPPVPHVPWTGDPVSMANAMRDLHAKNDNDRIVDSLGMLWIRSIVDTLRMMKLDPAAFQVIIGWPRFQANGRLKAALDVVEGRAPQSAGLPSDQAIELRAMHDVPNWPSIIGPYAPRRFTPIPNSDQMASSDTTSDPVLNDPRYYDALYDAIRRNRAMAGTYALQPRSRGVIYVGPSHKDNRPSGLDVPDARRKEVNEALWKELGVGEGTQASVNTWDSAKFSFGPGFAAPGLLREVMDILAKSGPDVLARLRTAGLIYENRTWYAVDPESKSVKAGAAALEVMSKDIGLISTFLDTAMDPALRRRWMDAEWEAMRGAGGAAAIPDQVVLSWPVDRIVFVAHCVHWRPALSWKPWESPPPPSVFQVVREMAPLVDRRSEDSRILTLQSAQTFLGFSGGLLLKTLKERGKRQGIEANLPEDWDTAHSGAVALPTKATTPVFQIIEAGDN